ncbi:hypothetical protein G4B88_031576, partial [Cannabis sativa]
MENTSDHEKESLIGEIQEEEPPIFDSNPNRNNNPSPKSVRTKVPEVEVHLYRTGKGPIDVFKSSLGGWDQDQLEVRNILDKYGFKSLFAFSTQTGRGVPIRFHARNGRSLLPYKDGSVIYVDGEPKETPQWMKKFNVTGVNFPPWILACVVIVFTRMRKRTKDLLNKHG